MRFCKKEVRKDQMIVIIVTMPGIPSMMKYVSRRSCETHSEIRWTAEYRSLQGLEQRAPSYQSKGYIVLFYLISLGGNIGSVCVCNFNLIESLNHSITVSYYLRKWLIVGQVGQFHIFSVDSPLHWLEESPWSGSRPPARWSPLAPVVLNTHTSQHRVQSSDCVSSS